MRSELLCENVIASQIDSARAMHSGLQAGRPTRWLVHLLFASSILSAALFNPLSAAQPTDWNQGGGPSGDFNSANAKPPAHWSVVRGQNIRWVKRLPETGQSAVITNDDRIYFSTMAEVDSDSELGSTIVAWCCRRDTGATIWKREIEGEYPLRLSGCFSDSSAPTPVCDGTRVCFFNASGTIRCFDLDGKVLWTVDAMPVGRTQPFLIDGAVAFIRQNYMPVDGHFTHEHGNAPLARWTQLQTLEMTTGEVRWTTTCGANMGCVPVPYRTPSGRDVIMVGRGGGHSPPEKPEGISLVDGADGSTIWTLPLEGFMSTMSLNFSDDDALIFHRGDHLWVDLASGQVRRRVSILAGSSLRAYSDGDWSDASVASRKAGKREIIQQSNLLVSGRYHFFRSYTQPWLGRVDVRSGIVEYLQLPTQLKRSKDSDDDVLLWGTEDMSVDRVSELRASLKEKQKTIPITSWSFTENSMRNSRGFTVVGDQRSRGSGWGHHASQVPSASSEYLYIPVMNGTVYVIRPSDQELSEESIVAINDLGPVGESWTRASLSLSGGSLIAHTIDAVICIESLGHGKVGQ